MLFWYDCIGDIIIVEIWWVYEGCFLESGKFIVLGFGKGGGICFWLFIYLIRVVVCSIYRKMSF